MLTGLVGVVGRGVRGALSALVGDEEGIGEGLWAIEGFIEGLDGGSVGASVGMGSPVLGEVVLRDAVGVDPAS